MSQSGTFVHADVEVLLDPPGRGGYRGVLFDFDGTLSLIREGWPAVMLPMMLEALRATPTTETDEQLSAVVNDFVAKLTGRQTIYQMIRLAEEVTKRGGTPEDPLAYKHRYNDLLMARIESRHADILAGRVDAERWTVPGTFALLEGLRRRGVTLYLASGTDIAFVKREAEMLGVAEYFGEHIYGALDDYKQFSKKMIIDRVVREVGDGAKLLGFGDGFVETQEVKGVGGTAIAVASDEARREGVDAWKRERLIGAGADAVVPHYARCAEGLLGWLFS